MKAKKTKIEKALVVVENGSLITEKSRGIIEKIITSFKEGVDYAVVVDGKKPTLLIPGADKLSFDFNLMATFQKDTDVLEMLKDVKGLVALKCLLVHRDSGKTIGEGKGCAVLGSGQNCKEPNSAVKMCEIRAKRDAILNTFCLRDRFENEDLVTAKSKKKVSINNETGEVIESEVVL